MQRDLNNHSLEISLEHRRNIGLYEIELILNKNGRSLKDYPPVPSPPSDMMRRLGNELIR